MRICLGLKVYSTNTNLIPEAIKLHKRGLLEYVEVFCVPDSYKGTNEKWRKSGIPSVVHAAHSLSGLNFSKKEMADQNRALAKESFLMADALSAEKVIFHPGTDGRLEETIRQAKSVFDSRMVFENKPLKGLDGSTCVGSTPEELFDLCESLGVGFCLDFGHAVASANSHGIEPLEYIEKFNTLNPVMYHLTDGDYKAETDRHDKYGQGSFPLKKMLGLVPPNACVTDESKRVSKNALSEYLANRFYLENNIYS